MAVVLNGIDLEQFLSTSGQALELTRAVTCNIKIENYTNKTLVHQRCDIGHGEIPRAPGNIEPGVKYIFGSQKGEWTFYGFSAICSWKTNDRLIFMYWQVPLSFFGGYNMLFIGITKPGVTHEQLSFAAIGEVGEYPKLIQRTSFTNLFKSCRMGKFEDSTFWLEVEDENIKVRATMGTNKQCEATMHIIPKRESDYAQELRKKAGVK